MYNFRLSELLYDGLSDPELENWRDIVDIQRHWIGTCDGYRVEMAVTQKDPTSKEENTRLLNEKLDLWMSQPELLYGISFIGVKSGSQLDSEMYRTVKQYDYQLLSVYAVCPISQRLIPVIVCDNLPYVEKSDYYIGIPCISSLDKEVAKSCNFITTEIKNDDSLINSGILNGLSIPEARQVMLEHLDKCGAGGYKTSSKLHDWLLSRQRYWGTPIPIIHCPECGVVPVPEDQLPVQLPKITNFTKRGTSPLKAANEWKQCQCPR